MLLFGVGSLSACSDDNPRGNDSERRVIHAEAPVASSSSSSSSGTVRPAGAANRYKVLAEITYLYDSPRQTKPTGQYLRRGDVLYGEDDDNGLVRTQFVAPGGATVTGWLKAEELGKLAGTGPSRPQSTASSAPRRAVPVPTQPASAPVARRPAGDQTATVQVARSYFYDSPDLTQPRRAHCVRGDKVQLGETQGEAVYVTFTNWEKVTTSGWMRRDALQ